MNGGGHLAVAFKPSHFTRDKDGAPSEVFPPLSADADKGDQEPVVAYRTSGNCGAMEQGDKTAALNTATDPNQNIIAIQEIGKRQSGTPQNGEGFSKPGAPMFTLQSTAQHGVSIRTMVRRLTPIECARLQSHPDDWAVWGINAQGERVEQSDSSQYRQYGNGVTANVLEFIARRIKPFLTL